MRAPTKEQLARQLRLTADALMISCSTNLRDGKGIGNYWSEWAAAARASYELLGQPDSFWELAAAFGMVPVVAERP